MPQLQIPQAGVHDPMPGVAYPPADRLARYLDAGLLTRETLAGALTHAFEQHRDRPAIVGPQGTLTHGQLDERSDRLAAALLALGIRPLARALFQLANSADLVVAVLACLKVGVIPVCTLPSHRELEIGTLGRHAQASLWFVQGDDPRFDLRGFAQRLRPSIDSVREVVVAGGEALEGQHGMEALIAAQPPGEARCIARAMTAQLDPFQVALFQLSGGTTGVSKLIPRFSNEYLYNMRAVLQAAGRRAPEVCFCGGPFLHNAGFVLHWGPALLLGGAIAIGADLSEEGLLRLFTRERPTWAYLPKPLAIRLADGLRARGVALDSLHTVMTTAAADFVRRELGARAINIYGMAEGIVMMPRADAPFEVTDASVGTPVSPLDELRLVHPGTQTEVAEGETGELLVRGPTTLHGYYLADERNRALFTDEGYLRTGDLMQRLRIGDRACFAFKGRLKDVIKRAGESIDCGEIERALCDHPAIADAAVVGLPDARYGERACACLVLKAGAAAPTVAQLGEHLRELGFAKYKWPEFIHLVQSFPLTPSGKLSKPLLREQAGAARQAATPGTGATMTTQEAPRPLTLNGVHHTARPTWKLRETMQFYRDKLGLPLLHAVSAKGWGRDAHPDFVHFFFDSGNGSTIAFFYYLGTRRPDWLTPRREDHNYRATHTAWLVRDRGELMAWKARLEAQGIEVYQTPHEVIESIYFQDPNGYGLEITVATRPFLREDAQDATRTLEAAMALEDEAGGPEGMAGIDAVWRRKAAALKEGGTP